MVPDVLRLDCCAGSLMRTYSVQHLVRCWSRKRKTNPPPPDVDVLGKALSTRRGMRTRCCRLPARALKWARTPLPDVRVSEAVWGASFFTACLAHGHLVGQQLRRPLSPDCSLLPRGPRLVVAGGKGGGEGGAACLWGVHHFLHTHKHFLPLEGVPPSSRQR